MSANSKTRESVCYNWSPGLESQGYTSAGACDAFYSARGYHCMNRKDRSWNRSSPPRFFRDSTNNSSKTPQPRGRRRRQFDPPHLRYDSIDAHNAHSRARSGEKYPEVQRRRQDRPLAEGTAGLRHSKRQQDMPVVPSSAGNGDVSNVQPPVGGTASQEVHRGITPLPRLVEYSLHLFFHRQGKPLH